MCAAVDSDRNKKKMKQKSMMGYCNDFLNRIVPSSAKSMLKTDAVPMDSGQSASNDTELSNENTSRHINVLPSNVQFQMAQNNLNQANQNLTVIESQQNLQFNNIRGLQIGNTFHVSGSNSRKNSYNGSKTRSLIELMNCSDPIEVPTMRIAARFIGENWRMVFRDLDFTDAEIAQVREQYFHINVEEVIYQLLLRWQRNSDDPSLGKLSTVLWENKNHECVGKLKRYFKENKKSQINSTMEASENDMNGTSTCDRESE